MLTHALQVVLISHNAPADSLVPLASCACSGAVETHHVHMFGALNYLRTRKIREWLL
jgi:hypothetical protein